MLGSRIRLTLSMAPRPGVAHFSWRAYASAQVVVETPTYFLASRIFSDHHLVRAARVCSTALSGGGGTCIERDNGGLGFAGGCSQLTYVHADELLFAHQISRQLVQAGAVHAGTRCSNLKNLQPSTAPFFGRAPPLPGTARTRCMLPAQHLLESVDCVRSPNSGIRLVPASLEELGVWPET